MRPIFVETGEEYLRCKYEALMEIKEIMIPADVCALIMDFFSSDEEELESEMKFSQLEEMQKFTLGQSRMIGTSIFEYGMTSKISGLRIQLKHFECVENNILLLYYDGELREKFTNGQFIEYMGYIITGVQKLDKIEFFLHRIVSCNVIRTTEKIFNCYIGTFAPVKIYEGNLKLYICVKFGLVPLLPYLEKHKSLFFQKID